MKKRILSIFLAALMLLTVVPFAYAAKLAIGDIDGDGSIKAADARLALRASVGLENFSDEQKAAADVDFDGAIKAADARLILRASVGLEELKDPHTHAYTIETVTTKATCTKKGEKKLSCECGEFITEEIPASGHKEVKDKAVAASCTKDGKTEGSHCSVCGEVLKAQKTVSKTGHTAKLDQSTVRAATCTKDGYSGDYKCTVCGAVTKKGSVIKSKGTEHSLKTESIPASCTQDGYSIKKCQNCEYYDESSYTAGKKATGHKWSKSTTVKPTCSEKGYDSMVCSVCGADTKENYVDAAGHKYTWTTTTEATCTKAGVKTGTCSVCKEKTTEVIPLTACKRSSTPTYIAGSGSTPCKNVYTCTTCDKVLSEVEFHKTFQVKSTEATCTTYQTKDMKCRYCDYTETDVYVSKELGHIATLDTANSYDATCTRSGQLVYSGTCERCHEVLDDTVVVLKAKGHNLTGVQTCTTDVRCTNTYCDAENNIVEPRLGHSYTMHSAAFAKNLEGFYCERCGNENSDSLGVFNDVANSIKTYAFYNTHSARRNLAIVDKTKVTTTYSRFDFGIYTNTIKDMYEDEMANSETLSSIAFGGIRTSLYLINDYSTVSELESSDIDSIKVEKLAGLNVKDILASYPDTYAVGSRQNDLTPYKNVKVNDEVIKVTINVKNEKYSQVKSLPETTKTSLSKIYDFDIRQEANEFRNEKGELVMTEVDKGDGYEISMTMYLKEITTDATVTYYLLEDTYEPILALYNADVTMTQEIDMKFKIGLFSLNGEMDPIIETNYARVYFFPNFFTK